MLFYTQFRHLLKLSVNSNCHNGRILIEFTAKTMWSCHLGGKMKPNDFLTFPSTIRYLEAKFFNAKPLCELLNEKALSFSSAGS